jgi:hypothetical protein
VVGCALTAVLLVAAVASLPGGPRGTLAGGSGPVLGLSGASAFDWTSGFASSRLTRAQLAGRFGRVPLAFEPNRGQADARVRFLAGGRGYRMLLTEEGATLSLKHGGDSALLGMRFVGARTDARMSATGALGGRVNYLTGSDRSRWRRDIPTYGRVGYRSVYPGIDVSFYGNQSSLEYDFELAPGADPRAIALGFTGAAGKRLDAQGNLVLQVGGRELRQLAPVAHQLVNGQRQDVWSRFVLLSSGAVGIRTGSYDRSRPLVIDPVLAYSTYLGGTGDDTGFAVAVDAQGSAYLTGITTSSGSPGGFPTQSPGQSDNAGGIDAFVTKLNPAGTGLVYSTYLGGTGSQDYGLGIAVDAQGSAYVAGYTNSSGSLGGFPTESPLQADNGGGTDAFVTKLDATGSALVYSTYLGGSGTDVAQGIAVDAQGNAYVAGYTSSSGSPGGFPTQSPLQSTHGGGIDDVFVAKLNAAGSALVYSTYLGGAGGDSGNAIAVDAQGSAYVAGYTASSGSPGGFPTQGPIQANNGGGSQDAFVAKLNPAGSALVYSTYLGGGDLDTANGIAVDAQGSAYLTGNTLSLGSTPFPTQNPFQPNKSGNTDVFVAKLNPAGSALVYSTYLGGPGIDRGQGIAVDGQGSAYLTGGTSSFGSPGFPTQNPIQATSGGGGFDGFVTKLNSAGSALVYSTYLGGGGGEISNGIAVDCAGNAYVTGETQSSGGTPFPTQNPFQPNKAGGVTDATAAKISDSAATASQPPCPNAGGPGGTGGQTVHGGHGVQGVGQAPIVGTGADGGNGGPCGGGGTGGGGTSSNGGGGGGGCFNAAGTQGLNGGNVTASAGVATNNSTVRAEVFTRARRRSLIGQKTMTGLPIGRYTIVIRLSAKARKAFKRLRRTTVTLRLRMTAPTGPPLIVTRTVTLRR